MKGSININILTITVVGFAVLGSSLWGWRSPGTGCPGRLWSLLLWRYSRPAWIRSCAACCRWPCFGRRVGLDDPQRSLPTPAILWFCVILWSWPKAQSDNILGSGTCHAICLWSARDNPTARQIRVTRENVWWISCTTRVLESWHDFSTQKYWKSELFRLCEVGYKSLLEPNHMRLACFPHHPVNLCAQLQ